MLMIHVCVDNHMLMIHVIIKDIRLMNPNIPVILRIEDWIDRISIRRILKIDEKW